MDTKYIHFRSAYILDVSIKWSSLIKLNYECILKAYSAMLAISRLYKIWKSQLLPTHMGVLPLSNLKTCARFQCMLLPDV